LNALAASAIDTLLASAFNASMSSIVGHARGNARCLVLGLVVVAVMHIASVRDVRA